MRHQGHKKAVTTMAQPSSPWPTISSPGGRLTNHEFGNDYYDRRQAEQAKQGALSTLERQGYQVTLETVA